MHKADHFTDLKFSRCSFITAIMEIHDFFGIFFVYCHLIFQFSNHDLLQVYSLRSSPTYCNTVKQWTNVRKMITRIFHAWFNRLQPVQASKTYLHSTLNRRFHHLSALPKNTTQCSRSGLESGPNLNVNVICLPAEHQGAQRTRSNVAVHSQIGLEFGNVGFWGEGKTGVPGEKPLGAE